MLSVLTFGTSEAPEIASVRPAVYFSVPYFMLVCAGTESHLLSQQRLEASLQQFDEPKI